MTSSHESDYIVEKWLQYLIVKKLTIGIRHIKDNIHQHCRKDVEH